MSPTFTSTIPWSDGQRTFTFTSISALKCWLSTQVDLGARFPTVYDHLGNEVEWGEDPWSRTGNVWIKYEGSKY